MKDLDLKIFDGQITENFNLSEFKCRDNGELLVNSEALNHIDRLQRFRSWYNRPMRVNSGYRTPEYNKKIGGAAKSKHMKGIASDIALPQEFYSFTSQRREQFFNNIRNKWFDLCSIDGVNGGVGFYDTFFHLDSRTSIRAFWDNRT